MKFYPVIALVMNFNFAISAGAEVPVDLSELGKILEFPQEELICNDISEEYRKLNEAGILSTFRIDSKTPFAFYPILISVAREGTFITEKSEARRKELDSFPEGEIPEGGRGPFGTLLLEGNIVGGLFLGEVQFARPVPPGGFPQTKMSVFVAATLPAHKVDFKIAMIASFSGGQSLVRVTGGEGYYKKFSPQPEDAVAAPDHLPFKQSFRALSKMVIDSPLVKLPRGKLLELPPAQGDPLIDRALNLDKK